MHSAKVVAKRIIASYRRAHMHITQNRTAMWALRTIEEQRGKLDGRLVRTCDEYALERLGSKQFAPWLYVYSAIAGEFKEHWLPDNYFALYVVPMLKGSYGDVSFLPSLANPLFRSSSFPNVGAYVNQLFLVDGEKVVPENEVKDMLFSSTDRLVFKADFSNQGKGVYFFDPDTFDPVVIKRIGNGVFQRYLRQHAFFDEIVSGPVSTLRLTTVVDAAGEASLRAAFLRIGRATDSHVTEATSLDVAVDPRSGVMQQGFLDWKSISHHPDTGYVFAGKTLPLFSKCVETVLALQRKLPQVRTIGWDVIVDRDNEVRVMEWNGQHNDIKFSEATQGPCFADLDWDKLHLSR